MKVVILAGGYGTRIRDVADDIPKPMIPIGPYPILLHIMKTYAHFGHKDFIICCGYKGHLIKDFFLNYESYTRDFTISFGKSGNIEFHSVHEEEDWKVTLADTGLSSMTGSRISKIRNYIGDDTFLLTYGDGVSDVNINKLTDFHESHNKVLTVTGVRPPGRFGELVANNEGMITEFNEKHTGESSWINGGFFVFESDIFDYLKNDDKMVFEKKPLETLAQEKKLAAFKHTGFWYPMDTLRDKKYLENLLRLYLANRKKKK